MCAKLLRYHTHIVAVHKYLYHLQRHQIRINNDYGHPFAAAA
jgi:hypothetical protein